MNTQFDPKPTCEVCHNPLTDAEIAAPRFDVCDKCIERARLDC